MVGMQNNAVQVTFHVHATWHFPYGAWMEMQVPSVLLEASLK